jgi:hypothetical protein
MLWTICRSQNKFLRQQESASSSICTLLSMGIFPLINGATELFTHGQTTLEVLQHVVASDPIMSAIE